MNGPPSHSHGAVQAGRLTAAIAAAWLCARAAVDPDLWGHLKFGLDLLTTGRLTPVDPYSFTQDSPWINHEWLSELIFALAYRGGGVFGLVLLKTTILGTAGWLLVLVARPAELRARWWLLAASLLGLAPAAATFRPQLWTILGLAILCRILSSGRGVMWIPVLFALWANLHGGWIVGACLAGLWIAGRMLDARRLRVALPEVIAVAVGIASTIINPYGWRLWLFLWSTVRQGRNVTEWRPLWEQTDPSHGVIWCVIAALVLATAVMRRSRLTWATLLPVAWLGMSGLFVDRLSTLFAEVAILATAAAWSPTVVSFAARSDGERETRTTSRPPGAAIIDAAIVLCVWGFNAIPASRCLPVVGSWAPDLSAASVFSARNVEGRLVLPFDWGEYAIWHWGPRLRVSIDGRRETIYTDELVALQSAVASGEEAGLRDLGRVRPEYVWLALPRGSRTAEWLTQNGYRLDVKTNDSFVAVRTDLPALAEGPPVSRCFP